MNEESLFDAALAIPDESERNAFLDRECVGNPKLREAVEKLLSCYDSSNPLDRPAFDRATQLLDEDASQVIAGEVVGDTIDRYKLLEKIGEGGFGNVYVAEQEKPVCRRVAIKVIKPGMDSKQVIGRFEAERQALAMMDHVNIAKVLDAGTTERGRPYFVMELVHGTPITTYCDENQLSPRERLELFIPVCQAIQHAHQKGIIHRDIKPSNVLVTMYDDRAVPKVIDFGVSKAIDQRLTEKTVYTQYGAMVGTLEYLSPEQAEMNAFGVDTRSDVYSLGALLYELLTGAPPLERQELHSTAFAEMIRRIKEQDPALPSLRIRSSATLQKVAAARRTEPGRLSAEVQGELDWIVMRCLEKDRTRRYEGASALAQDLQRYLANEPVDACPPTIGYRLRKAYQRHRSAVWSVSLLASALIAVAVISITWAVSARRAADKAELLRLESQENAQLATRNQQLAEDRLEQVTASRAKLAQTEYATSMRIAQFELQRGNVRSVRRLLDRTAKTKRGWEWNYLDRVMQSEKLCLVGHQGRNRAASFSPDGSMILTANQERRACLWYGQAGTLIRLFESPTGEITDAAFDPTGKRILIAAADLVRHDSEIRVIDSSTGKLLLTLPQESPVWTARFDREGARIVGACRNGKIICWDVSTGKALTTISSSPAFSLEIHSDGSLVAGHGDGVIRIWNLETGQLIKEILGHDGPIHGIALNPDGTKMVSSGVDLKVIVWDFASGKKLLNLSGHANEVRSVAFSPDGNLIASGSDDRTARIWDASTGKLKQKFIGHMHEIRSVAFGPKGDLVVTGSSDGTAKIWEIAGDKSYPFQKSLPRDLIVGCSVDGRRLLTRVGSDRDPTKKNVHQVWDTQDQSILLEISCPDGFRDLRAALSDDGQYVVGYSSDGVITRWSVKTQKRVNTFETSQQIFRNAISSNAHFLAISRSDRAASLWDLRSGMQLPKLAVPEEPTWAFGFCPHKRVIAGGGTQGTLTIWDAGNGQIRHEIKAHRGLILSSNFSPDGSLVVTASDDGMAKIWNVNDGTLVKTLAGHSGRVNSAQFSPDGSRILTSSVIQDLTARLWDASNGVELLSIPLPERSHTPFFNADGSGIIIARRDQPILILRGDSLMTDPVRVHSPRESWFTQHYSEPQRRLWDASSKGDVEGVRSALRDGGEINLMDTRYNSNGRYALNYAVKQKSEKLIEILIDAGADVNLQNHTGFTALHHAAEYDVVPVARQLLAAGANPSLKNRFGRTPLEEAKALGHQEVAQEIQRAASSGKSLKGASTNE